MIRNLIFDFGKVLVDYDFMTFFKANIPDEDRRKVVAPIIFNVELQQLLDRELKCFDEILDEWVLRHPDFEPEIRTFQAKYAQVVTGQVPGMFQLLTRLKSQGYKLYGLTNWCSKVHITMQQFPIFQLLDGSLISSEEKVIKPEPAIYHRLFEKFQLKPEECIFTDDRPENIEAGRQLGMQGIVFQNAQQYEQELQQLLKH